MWRPHLFGNSFLQSILLGLFFSIAGYLVGEFSSHKLTLCVVSTVFDYIGSKDEQTGNCLFDPFFTPCEWQSIDDRSFTFFPVVSLWWPASGIFRSRHPDLTGPSHWAVLKWRRRAYVSGLTSAVLRSREHPVYNVFTLVQGNGKVSYQRIAEISNISK